MGSLASLLVLASLAAPPQTDLVIQAEGTMRLRCKTRWHTLDLPLQARKRVRVPAEGLLLLGPPDLREGARWQIKGSALAPLAHLLQAISWESRPQDQQAYTRWQGSNPTRQSMHATGELTCKLERGDEGFRVRLSGLVEVIDEGWLANRYGPNGWKHTWRHQLKGTLLLNAKGQIHSCTLDDTIQVKGSFNSDNLDDPFTQEGSLKLQITAPKPLSPTDARKVKQLIVNLGADTFLTREQANETLLNMGPDIAPLLRSLGLTHPDPEVRTRVQKILKQLSEERGP
jgi:hypothetical protein